MRAVVTGAAGFIGSTIVDALLKRDWDVVGIDAFIDYYPREDKVRNLAGALSNPRFALAELDLRSDDLSEPLSGADLVIHAAAMPGLSRSWHDFELYESCNLRGTQRVVVAASRAGVGRLLHISTSSVYGADAVGGEDSPTSPVSPYGITKLAAEHVVRAYGDIAALDYVILRYFSVYGPRQRPDMAYRIFIEAMLDGRPIEVYGDATQVRSNTYVDDAVAATILAAERAERGRVYNVGGGEPVVLRDAIRIIAALVGETPNLVFKPTRPGDQRRTEADITRARDDLGYEPVVPVEAGLSNEVAWVRARRATSVAR